MIATMILGELLRPKPKFDQPQPSSLGDFTLPTAQEGRAIPYVCGTVLLAGGNVTWWGDLRVDPIRKKVRTGLFSHSWITTGYKYYLGIQMALCFGPIDGLSEMKADNKLAPVSGFGYPFSWTTDTWSLEVVGDNMFGGNESEGGLSGIVELYRGTKTQNANAYLSAKQGRPAPAYRGVCYAVFQSFYVGTSAYIKAISFTLKRLPNPFAYTDGTHDLAGDANPALVAYDLLTSLDYGLGIPAGKIDVASFESAAHTLKTEGLGISMQIDTPSSADQLLGEVCRHMDGVIYTDPATGLWTLVLARQDYDPDDLLVLDQNSCLDVPQFSRGSWSETLNEIKISYIDRAHNFTQRVSLPAQDLGNASVTHEMRSATMDFRGLSNATTVALVAMRVLRTYSFPIAKISIATNRSAWKLRPASVFKFSYPPLGIENEIFRVVKITYGELVDGKITIDATEDIFGINESAFVAPPSGWQNPNVPPQPVAAQELEEVPYQLNPDGIAIMVLGARADAISTSIDVYVDGTLSNSLPVFTPSGLIEADFPKWTLAIDATGFTVDGAGANDLSQLLSTDSAGVLNGNNLALIDDEIVSWTTVVINPDGSATITDVLRGAYDTVPALHLAGARVWFFSDGAGLTRPDPYPSDVALTNVQLVTRSPSASLPLSSAVPMGITTHSRELNPLPPGNLHLRAYAYATWKTTTLGDVDINWNFRNRLAQTIAGGVVRQDDLDVGTPEGNYTAHVYIGGTMIRTTSGISAGPYTYPIAQRITDDADGSKSVEIEIVPVNGSLTGNSNRTPAFVMTGFGVDFGHHFGGIEA